MFESRTLEITGYLPVSADELITARGWPELNVVTEGATVSDWQGLFFWGFLLLFGGVMYALSPRARDEAGFFRGHDAQGRPASEWALMSSIFISWIFAKSVTNAANLGAAYGVVGGLAYARTGCPSPSRDW